MIATLLVLTAHLTSAVSVAPEEMDQFRSWVATRFADPSSAPQLGSGIDVVANHGDVQVNARGGKPMHLGTTPYSNGFYCHAPSRMVVHLTTPAQKFEALVGVDSNDQTSGGRGSVVFSVAVGGAEVWHSEILREGMPAQAVSVPLNGARDFELLVSDAGDGISSDQADWINPIVTREDGTALPLSDVPILTNDLLLENRDPVFSFSYGGNPSRGFLNQWKQQRESRTIADARHGTRTKHTVVYRDPATALLVRCEGIEYNDFPVIEWTLYFRNEGAQDSPILSDINAIDTRIGRDPESGYVVHQIRGDDCTPQSYQPFDTPLAPATDTRIANTGGRPTQMAFPYFNIEWGGRGLIYALGWPGQWATRFVRDTETGLRIVGGQELTHFTLHPGEEVRGPLVVLMPYQGDWMRAQNLWRRWMVAHNLPWPGGKPVQTMRSLCNGNFYPGLMTVASQEKDFLQKHLDAGVAFDCWWQDAGWYPCEEVGWPKTGTWAVDPQRFPKGIRELSDFMRANGKVTMVWFEPERVHPGTWITENHPEWVHGGKDGGLLKLGEPACREWLTLHINSFLNEQGIEYYRQDFNIDPLPFWRAADTEDRQGISEIRHVEGYLVYWDGLLQRHPGMLIDSCASGGRRNDLETLRRAVPLLRSDWYASPEGQQCLTYGLSLWFPYQGTGVIYDRDIYWWRSSMVAEMSFGPDAAGLDNVHMNVVKRAVDEHKLISPCLMGDFYPLTPYTQSNAEWMAWQFDRPDLGQGVVQVFRRPDSIYESAHLKLKALDPDARYAVLSLDALDPETLTGKQLMEEGLPVIVTSCPQAITISYRKVE
ncbi:MAG: NPCBM/NEW2 domain-containing protein [Candidatus Hydrogenedentales bacterium]|jgi:alpha-galactosidase